MPETLSEQLFLNDLAQLDALLYFREKFGCSTTLHTLLKEIRRAAAMIKGGCYPRLM